MAQSDPVYNVLVLGGGVNGLSTLYHLTRYGLPRIGLVEQFRLRHDRGSSHGQSRITRSAYVHADYVRLMQIAHGQEWPRLERDAGRKLLHPTPGCFFGASGGKFDRYARAVAEAGVNVERLDLPEARRRFPAFRFENAAGVLHDRTAALVASADTLSALEDLCRRRGARFHERTPVLGIDLSRDPIRLETASGSLETERLVVAAGAWSARLLPCLASRLAVARQTVGYFTLSGPPETFRVGRFPVWGNLATEPGNGFYGLPEFGRPGIKVARHVVAGRSDNPDETPEVVSAAIDDLKTFLEAQFVPRIERFEGAETCLYTNTDDEDFILDRHPENPNVVFGAGFSGHGFKFGPLTGRILADLVLRGKTDLPEFEAARARFALPP